MNAIATIPTKAVPATAIATQVAKDSIIWAEVREAARMDVDPNAITGAHERRARKNLKRLEIFVERHAELIAFRGDFGYEEGHFDHGHNLVKISRAASKALIYGADEGRVESAVLTGLANARVRIAFAN